jgi:hypothetical protein
MGKWVSVVHGNILVQKGLVMGRTCRAAMWCAMLMLPVMAGCRRFSELPDSEKFSTADAVVVGRTKGWTSEGGWGKVRFEVKKSLKGTLKNGQVIVVNYRPPREPLFVRRHPELAVRSLPWYRWAFDRSITVYLRSMKRRDWRYLGSQRQEPSAEAIPRSIEVKAAALRHVFEKLADRDVKNGYKAYVIKDREHVRELVAEFVGYRVPARAFVGYSVTRKMRSRIWTVNIRKASGSKARVTVRWWEGGTGSGSFELTLVRRNGNWVVHRETRGPVS